MHTLKNLFLKINKTHAKWANLVTDEILGHFPYFFRTDHFTGVVFSETLRLYSLQYMAVIFQVTKFGKQF